MQDQPGLAPPSPPPAPERSGHPITGILSFILGLLSWLPFLAAMVLSFLVLTDPSLIYTRWFTLIGLMPLCSGLIVVAGVVLGIIALVQRTRKLIFGILGLVLNLLVVCAFAGIMLLGNL